MIHFHIITLFPESISGYFDSSILKRAQDKKLIKISYYNPRDYTNVPLARVDKRPYGGGPGMVLEALPILTAVRKAVGTKKATILFFATNGTVWTETIAKKMVIKKSRTIQHVVLICGHYEGIDERVATILKVTKISLGDYVLTGGELVAAIVVDTLARFVPGVLGNSNSLENSRVSLHTAEAVDIDTSPITYTRPEVLVWKGKKHKVPKVLLSGNHADIEQWKKDQKQKL